ncbi:MAG: carbohydrate kinase family protein [Bacillota bacterium]
MSKCIVVGGCNVDIFGKSNGEIIPADSNIGKIGIFAGGVGRNIAENIARMGEETQMLSALGNDANADFLRNNLSGLGIDYSLSESMEISSSCYMFIADNKGEMQLAVSDMEIYDIATAKMLEGKFDKVNQNEILVLDTNFSQDVIDCVFENTTIPIFVDTVSTKKAEKIKKHLSKITYIKPNALEAEVLTGIKVEDEESAIKACDSLINQGVKCVFLTLSEKGGIAKTKDEFVKSEIFKAQTVNTTGAGDSFVGGAVFGILQGASLSKILNYAMAAASICVQSQDTISKELTREKLLAVASANKN